jgi:hypothetical protein
VLIPALIDITSATTSLTMSIGGIIINAMTAFRNGCPVLNPL